VIVVSTCDVVSPVPATVAVALAFTNVPLGSHPESVSILTVTLSVGAPVFNRDNFIVLIDTQFPITLIDCLVRAAASHTTISVVRPENAIFANAVCSS
jgi:hypothetical protein